MLTLAEAGDVAGALDGFRRQAAESLPAGTLALADEAMIDELFRGVPDADIRWLVPGVRVLWAAEVRDSFPSYDGYARDNVSWGGSWDIDPTNLTVPTWLWYGDADRAVPLSHGQWLAEQIPRLHPDRSPRRRPREAPSSTTGTTCSPPWSAVGRVVERGPPGHHKCRPGVLPREAGGRMARL